MMMMTDKLQGTTVRHTRNTPCRPAEVAHSGHRGLSAKASFRICATTMASSAAGAEPQLPALLLFRVREVDFHGLLRERYRVLDHFTSGESSLPAFLAAAAASADPPRAALIVGGATPARVDAAFLDAVPSLRFVFNTGAGMDHIDLAECARRGVAVANSGTVYSTDVADHAVGMLIDVLRRVSAAQRLLRRGLWPPPPSSLQADHQHYPLVGTKVGGKRVGIIGLGNIGMLIAKRLAAFGCVIHYTSRRPKESAASYKYFATVQDLASESDVLVVACALSKETRHVVNRDVLGALGKDGVVVNIGRGPIIDEDELVAALREGRIAGAGLDVFEKEPKVPAELFDMDNVVLTPHVAVFTTESRADLRDVAIGNLEAFFAGKPLLTPVVQLPRQQMRRRRGFRISVMASSAAGAKDPPALLVFRARELLFLGALRRSCRVLDFLASGEPLPAFLAAAAAGPDPPRAALVVGGGSARVDAAFLDAVPSLRFVFSTGAGLDHIDLVECARRGVAVANSGTVYSTDVADHAVGLLVDVLRRVSAAERYLRRGLWPLQGDYGLGTKLGGKRVGIIGLGNIGSLIAKRLEAFGCVIYYNSRKPKESVSYKFFATVHDLARESDVLVVACALSKETRHIVNKDVLDALGKDGVVINVGRGLNVEEAELVSALAESRIAGAGLDVYEKEPKVPAELLSMDNVVLTHHVAVFTEESRSDLREVTIGNLEAFFSGKPLLTPVLVLPR